MRKTVIGALALSFAFAASPAAFAQVAVPAELVQSCASGDCTTQVADFAAAVEAAGGDVDAALLVLVNAVRTAVAGQPPAVVSAAVASAARAAAAAAVSPDLQAELTQVAAAADAAGTQNFETAASQA